MTTYTITPTGRRTLGVLMVAAVIIWLFAIWTFRSTLDLSYNPLLFFGSLQAAIDRGLTIDRVVPALLMFVLLIATPLVLWNLLEEWFARYSVLDDGLQFESLGVALVYPWTAVRELRHVDDDNDEPMDELVLTEDLTAQIRNPLLRFLHGQAYGRKRLPIYAGIERRGELLSVIQQRAGLPTAEPVVGAVPGV